MELPAHRMDGYVFRHELNTKSDHKPLEVAPTRNAPTKLSRLQHHKYII